MVFGITEVRKLGELPFLVVSFPRETLKEASAFG